MDLYKEIEFLHEFSEIIEQEPENLEGLYSVLVKRLPMAMTYPESCFCRIIVSDLSYTFGNNNPVETSINKKIVSAGKNYGNLIVGYNREKLDFTPNEIELVRYLCKRLGRIIERCQNKKYLDRATVQLEEKNKTLEIKNIAMAELLNQVQDNKDNMKKHISDMIQSTILPNLNALEDQIGQNVNIELLRITISGLINEDDKFLYNFTQLSQRELELCYLIKIGLSSKEIAEKFSISSKTVDKHRANIRTKLGIVGKKKNLSTSLLFLGQRK
jgi:hypothetical protein